MGNAEDGRSRRQSAAVEPIIDDRDREELFEALVERADAYTDRWDPHSPDVGRTLLRIFATFEADVWNRLNDVPAKHQLAFLDALDFDRRPPQAARVPLTFHVSADLDRNVPIPGGTQAVAQPTDGESQQFELPQDGGFEATPARLTDVRSLDPDDDVIVDHSELLEGEPVELFTGPNDQQHALYLANEDALNLAADSSLSLSVETDEDTDRFFERTVWEYYGEDAAGTIGWHRLEPVTESRETDHGVEALQARLQSRRSDEDADSERTFRLPGSPVSHEVDGVESRWLRCSVDDTTSSLPSTRVESLSVRVASTGREGGLAPDMLLANDVPLASEDGPLHPLGRVPQPPATCYVACREAFTKPGGQVDLEFHPAPSESEPSAETSADEEPTESVANAAIGVLGGPPRLSWEYWNGDGWTRLDSVEDETDALQTAGSVRFDVPQDISPTTVSGHENVWIRTRLVSGNYGQPSFDVTSEGTRGDLLEEPEPPTFADLRIHYDRGHQPFDRVVQYDNCEFSGDRSPPFSAFRPIPADNQTVYFGFDARLEHGPLSLFVPVEEASYPPRFDPAIEWEYCRDPAGKSWHSLDVQDRTAGLTERGMVTFSLPEPTTAVALFGRRRHWIRARVTNDAFETDRSAGSQPSPAEPVAADATTDRTTGPPTLEGLFCNTQWAENAVTIDAEVLGSSDGSHDQTFRCARAPVIDADVWVDERSTLPAGQRRRLLADQPERVDPEYDASGDLSAFWVRWSPVEDFLDSAPSDRHYVLNRTLGIVRFGDGDNGAIPPSGQDNVRATYTTGGGSDGNVDAGTITELKSSIALVDSVTNPTPADGGADIESTDALVDRSTNRLKHRDRAVTASDYERVAKAEFPELARVYCEPSLSEAAGTRVPVVIVPRTERETPVPSMELKHRVRETLTARAPRSLVEADDADIVVRGPNYAAVSVQATVRSRTVTSVSVLKSTVEDRLEQFLHPLSGNDGEGWPFGVLPTADTLSAVVADIDAVSELLTFDVMVERGGERRPLARYRSRQPIPRDTLVCSGPHETTITVGDDV